MFFRPVKPDLRKVSKRPTMAVQCSIRWQFFMMMSGVARITRPQYKCHKVTKTNMLLQCLVPGALPNTGWIINTTRWGGNDISQTTQFFSGMWWEDGLNTYSCWGEGIENAFCIWLAINLLMLAIPISAILSSCDWKPKHALMEASVWQLEVCKHVWGNLAAHTCQFKLYTMKMCVGYGLFASSRFPLNTPDITSLLVSCLHLCFRSTEQIHFAWVWVPRLLSFKTPCSQLWHLIKKMYSWCITYSHDCACARPRLDEAEHSSIIKKKTKN